jgi:adenine phosphoribosyltransferase
VRNASGPEFCENQMEFGRDKSLADRIASLIQIVPDFPHAKVRFRDLTPILENEPLLFRSIIDWMAELHEAHPPDCIMCIESWGYAFGAPLAYRLGTRICPARREGKLPGPRHEQDYDMCYAQGRSLQIHQSALEPGERVLIVDDVIASGGSALAAVKLVGKARAKCIGIACVAAFADGPFTKQIEDEAIPIHAIVKL